MPVGVDEAGKGPVLGSMFAAAVRCEPTALPDGVADSKTLSAERREHLAGEIRAVADVGIAEVPVERIDDPATNMNVLTVEAHAGALDPLVGEGSQCRVDAGETDAGRFGRRVAEALPCEVAITAEHGADATDPLVGAASIVAKVERDAHVARLAEEFGAVGSGYPSDPTTREFLRTFVAEEGDLPPCARRSWSTCADVLAAREQSALREF